MRRNEITTAGQLISGDRFYRLSDKGKKVFECGEKASELTVWIWSLNGADKRQKPSTIKSSEQVVFLRNTAEKYAEDIRKITHQQDDKGNTDSAL